MNFSFPLSKEEEKRLNQKRDLSVFLKKDLAVARLKRTSIMAKKAKIVNQLKDNEIEKRKWNEKIIYFQEKVDDYNVKLKVVQEKIQELNEKIEYYSE